ncbi:MAG TPA: phosphatase PAP2 family protein [Bryobacteraceae bacterium]|nr:phosphatase PAP2 family protein [Bryobacteraceae bacterium]
MRASEWLLAAYFVYAAAVAWIWPVKPEVRVVTLLLNLTILAGYALLVHADSLRRRAFLGVIRDWFPFPLMLLAYREMGWFAQPHLTFTLERLWVGWDRVLLYRCGLKALVEATGPVLPSLLEISYSLVYALGPFSAAMLYAYRRPKRMDTFLFTFQLGVLLCYAQFPFWPSEPPRTVFPGQDFPAYETVFRRFNWWMLGGYGIHTSVFPSAHVGGAFAAAFGMLRALPERPWVGRFLLVMAVLIATATVYGRYHYLADAAAGFGVALLALGISRIRSTAAASTAWRVKGKG